MLFISNPHNSKLFITILECGLNINCIINEVVVELIAFALDFHSVLTDLSLHFCLFPFMEMWQNVKKKKLLDPF